MSATQYEAAFQNTRDINATLIRDVLYIFTGTYPVYYKGDGNLYMFPEYQPSFSEQVVAGPNTLMDDFEDYYYGTDFSELPLNTTDGFKVIDYDFRPRIPYFLKEDGDTAPQIQIKAALGFPVYNTFTSFLPDNFSTGTPDIGDYTYNAQTQQFELFDGSEYTVVAPTESRGFGRYYEVRADVYFRPSSIGETSEDWIQLNTDSFDYDIYSNKPTDVDNTFDTIDGTIELPENQGTFDTLEPVTFRLNDISAGLRDIRIDLKLVRKAYTRNARDPDNGDFSLVVRFEELVLRTATFEFDEVEITQARLQNFPTEANPTQGGFTLHAPWSCNNVIEHYGKLIAWGSEEMPQTLFVSSANSFAYFPYNYTIDFNNDLKEAVNSVVPFMNILVVQSDSYTWGLKGNSPQIYIDEAGKDLNPNAYQVITINSSVGSIAPKSVRPVRNRLYFLSQEGLMELTSLFATDDRYNVKPLDLNIRNIIPQDRNAVAIQFDNQYWVHFPITGQTFRYYIDKQAWVKDSFNFETFNGLHKYSIKDGKLHFVTNPMVIESGNATIYEGMVDDSLATDFDQPIISQFLTSKMNQDYPFHWKRYKELKLDFSVQNEYMPNRAPLELTETDYGVNGSTVETTFSASLTKQHWYTVAYPIEIPDTITNLSVSGSVDSEIVNGMIRFRIGNIIPSSITVTFDLVGVTEQDINYFTVVDDTYDVGLTYQLRIMADNNTMIRDDYKDYVPMTRTIETGSQFENITFSSTNFGDVTTFVQTTKLYGNGYDVNVYYKDDSNIKWTLETMGIAYKMRRTRSDRRG